MGSWDQRSSAWEVHPTPTLALSTFVNSKITGWWSNLEFPDAAACHCKRWLLGSAVGTQSFWEVFWLEPVETVACGYWSEVRYQRIPGASRGCRWWCKPRLSGMHLRRSWQLHWSCWIRNSPQKIRVWWAWRTGRNISCRSKQQSMSCLCQLPLPATPSSVALIDHSLWCWQHLLRYAWSYRNACHSHRAFLWGTHQTSIRRLQIVALPLLTLSESRSSLPWHHRERRSTLRNPWCRSCGSLWTRRRSWQVLRFLLL